MKCAATTFNAWHHRTAVFIAFATFVVIVAGALVTSEGAGLSVPDWPMSYGHLLKLPPWVGGIVYEHSHRMIAWFTGFCTMVIGIWTWLVDKRCWMKGLAFGAIATRRFSVSQLRSLCSLVANGWRRILNPWLIMVSQNYLCCVFVRLSFSMFSSSSAQCSAIMECTGGHTL